MCGKHRTSQRRGPEEMQVHQVAQLVVGGLFNGADHAAACVVHQYVDPAVAVEDLGDGGLDAVGVGDVEL